MPSTEVVTLIAGGVPYTAWTSISIKYDAKSPERSFSVMAADEAPDLISAAWAFEPGNPVQVLGTGTLILDGFINTLDIDLEAEAHQMTVAGRCKGQDAVDCSVKHKTHEWRDKKLDAIANDTGNNTKFITDEALPNLSVVRANPGEKVAQFISRHARVSGHFISSTPQGKVKISKHGKERHAGAIVEGVNLLKGKATFDDKQRHASIKAKSQRHIGTKETATRIQEEAIDAGARAGRFLALMPHVDMSKGQARTRATHARDVRKGMSVKFTATLVGWRDEGGMIWTAGNLVYCHSILLHLDQDLCIESVELHQDEGSAGTTATLQLVSPEALGGKGGGKSRSAGGWNG